MSVKKEEYEIQASELVLDVGGGQNPFHRANVVVDLLPEDDSQRSGALEVGDRFFVQASGENLPFVNASFDYIWSNHTVEHSEDPKVFCKELSRVGKRGYLGAPSEIYEVLWHGHPYHNWILNLRYGKLIAVKKSDAIPERVTYTGKLFQVLQSVSPEFNQFYRSHFNIFKVNINWEDEIECVIQDDFPILDYNNGDFLAGFIADYKGYKPAIHKPMSLKLELSAIVSLMRCNFCLKMDLMRLNNTVICPGCGPIYTIQNERLLFRT